VFRNYRSPHYFDKAIGLKEAEEKRVFKTTDIVKRVGVITNNRVILKDFPVKNPIAVFNPAIMIKDNIAHVYARIILGYYMYISSIAEIQVPIEDIFNGDVNVNSYTSSIVIYPSTRYDIWGTEDPRVYKIDDQVFMTYTGRTVNYFNTLINVEKTLPITAIYRRKGWEKVHAYMMREELRLRIISDKDAFLVNTNRRFYLFHRPHIDEGYRLLISEIDRRELEHDLSSKLTGLRRIRVGSSIEALRPANFEQRLGWATPPIYIKPNEIIAFVHSSDREVQAYRLFAMEIEFREDNVVIKAITPTYIMEPRKTYEIIGDRTYTIFPCGIWKVDDKYLISYGAGDFMVGLGELDITELMALLDKGRIY